MSLLEKSGRAEFTCRYDNRDTLTIEYTLEGDLALVLYDTDHDHLTSFYVHPDDASALTNALHVLGARLRRDTKPMTKGMPVPMLDHRTPEEVEADEMESKRQRREASGSPVTFAEAMLPQPATVDAERAYLRSTELLGAASSVESRVELARFLMGKGRWA
ncbi:hypothetical protein OG401_23960 [Kitasatospora purpeofusca]|uniref:hypothetical protein n=1 Tax=Kitasatospora purpeofusca TaxID=67352 RepID=UPI002258BA61|nr:hypothetical protein [Kitasatospora purpeofusca]MCX4687320.1 hypothetical protein [Kitasatospora purpeofusca]